MYYSKVYTLLQIFIFAVIVIPQIQCQDSSPPLHSEMRCECTCSPVSEQTNILNAAGTMRLHVKERNQKRQDVEKTPNKNANIDKSNSEVPTGRLPLSILSNPAGVQNMKTVPGFTEYIKEAFKKAKFSKQNVKPVASESVSITPKRTPLKSPTTVFSGKTKMKNIIYNKNNDKLLTTRKEITRANTYLKTPQPSEQFLVKKQPSQQILGKERSVKQVKMALKQTNNPPSTTKIKMSPRKIKPSNKQQNSTPNILQNVDSRVAERVNSNDTEIYSLSSGLQNSQPGGATVLSSFKKSVSLNPNLIGSKPLGFAIANKSDPILIATTTVKPRYSGYWKNRQIAPIVSRNRFSSIKTGSTESTFSGRFRSNTPTYTSDSTLFQQWPLQNGLPKQKQQRFQEQFPMKDKSRSSTQRRYKIQEPAQQSSFTSYDSKSGNSVPRTTSSRSFSSGTNNLNSGLRNNAKGWSPQQSYQSGTGQQIKTATFSVKQPESPANSRYSPTAYAFPLDSKRNMKDKYPPYDVLKSTDTTRSTSGTTSWQQTGSNNNKFENRNSGWINVDQQKFDSQGSVYTNTGGNTNSMQSSVYTNAGGNTNSQQSSVYTNAGGNTNSQQSSVYTNAGGINTNSQQTSVYTNAGGNTNSQQTSVYTNTGGNANTQQSSVYTKTGENLNTQQSSSDSVGAWGPQTVDRTLDTAAGNPDMTTGSTWETGALDPRRGALQVINDVANVADSRTTRWNSGVESGFSNIGQNQMSNVFAPPSSPTGVWIRY